MVFSHEQVFQISDRVWESLTGMRLHASKHAPAKARGTTLTGCILISGAWDGAVIIHVSLSLARIAAANMYGSELNTISSAETHDAIGEIVNVTAGNFLPLLSGPCTLSLPTVTEGDSYIVSVPGSRPVLDVHAAHTDEAISVTIVERDATRSTVGRMRARPIA